jgi:hypothetical protein
MNILIVSQVFYPENFIINNFCKYLIENGHKVTVITGKPNYPKGEFFDGFGCFSKIKDKYLGCTVYRLPIYPRKNASNLNLILNYLSFAFIGSIFALFLRKKFDFSFVFAVSPITSAFPAIIHKFFYKTKLYLWVLDLWPESVTVGNRLNSKTLIRLLKNLVGYIYKHSDRIYISSSLMKKSIIKYQSYNSNFDIIHFPNWIRNFKSISDSKKYQDLVPNGFNIMLAGNIGVSIDYSNIIRAAKLLNNYEKINFLIVGSGSQEFKFKSEVNNCGLSNKIFFLGRYQNDEMPHFYVHADLMLISLADNELYSYTVPEKLQSYMSMKKTIIGMVSGESNQLIKKSGAGLSSNAGDYKALADNIRVLYEMSEVDRNKFGEKGYKYALDNFDLSKNINHILN